MARDRHPVPGPPGSSRRPRKLAEGAAYDQLVADGWKVTKRGWPHFFAWDKAGGPLGSVAFVIVKSEAGRRIKKHTRLVGETLLAAGLRVFIFDPANGIRAVAPGELEIQEAGGRGEESSSPLEQEE